MTRINSNAFFKTAASEAVALQTESAANGRAVTAAPAPIVALIPRGEVIRNFVYTGTFDRLAEETGLTLISVNPSSSIFEMLAEKYGEVYPLEEIRERWIVRFQRELIDMAHGRWLWSKAAQARWRWHDAYADTLRAKTVRTAKKILSRPFSNRPGLRLLSRLERAASYNFRTTEKYLELFRRLAPSLVFNGSHIHCRNAVQAVQAAQWLGIPTATFIFSWDNLTSQGRIILPYDYFLVWSESLKKQLLEMYEWIRPEQVFVTGTPQFDFHFQERFYQSREDFCRSVGADPKRPFVLYSTGMANHMPGEPEIVEEIADMLKEIGGETSPQLLVRVYPKDRSGRFDELKKRRSDILFPDVAWEKEWLTPTFEDSAALVNTLRHAALGINVASTVSLELCMFDKPAINVGYNPRSVSESELRYADYYGFDHYAPVVASGAVEVAYDRDEMRRMIGRALENPERLSAERKSLIEKMFGPLLDGNSARRVAEALLEAAAR
jgi:hypothetical protein